MVRTCSVVDWLWRAPRLALRIGLFSQVDLDSLIVFGILASFWEVCSTLLYCRAATSLFQVFSKAFVGGTHTPLFLDLHSLFGTYEWSEAC